MDPSASLSQAQDNYLSRDAGNPDIELGRPDDMEETLRQELTSFYEKQGRLSEAEAMYQRALAGYNTTLSQNHLSVPKAKNNLGRVYHNQGKLHQAGKLLQEALTGKTMILGLAHISTLRILNNLGSLFQDQGKLPEAEMTLKQALVGKAGLLGSDHPSTLRAKNDLVKLYRDQAISKANRKYFKLFGGTGCLPNRWILRGPGYGMTYAIHSGQTPDRPGSKNSYFSTMLFSNSEVRVMSYYVFDNIFTLRQLVALYRDFVPAPAEFLGYNVESNTRVEEARGDFLAMVSVLAEYINLLNAQNLHVSLEAYC
ncbi:hypothetical protein BDV09DRAFT_195760 [Aspergillus tetrazonus]